MTVWGNEMGYSVTWYVPQRVYIVHIYGDIGLEEYQAGIDTSTEFVRAGVRPVHAIIDARQITKFPVQMKAVVQSSGVFREPNLGWVLVLTDNLVVKFLTSVISQLSETRYKIFSHPEEALTFLYSRDVTLPDPDPYPILEGE